MVDGLLDSEMIIPDKPCTPDEINEAQADDNDEMPNPDRRKSPTDGVGRAGDGLRRFSVGFRCGFDFCRIWEAELLGDSFGLFDCALERR